MLKNVLSEEWKSSVLNVRVKETELKKWYQEVFYNLLYLQEKKNLLLKNDSMFAEFLSKSIFMV